MYITHVLQEFEGDTYFPEIDLNNWSIQSEVFHPKDEKHLYSFKIIEYIKKR